MEDLIKKIKEKKELRGIDDSVVSTALEDFLARNKISLLGKSEKEKKLIMKEVRASLRLLVGRFQKGTKSKAALLASGEIEELLKTHSSTSERISFYPKFREILNELKIKSILDIGCGLNPIALASKKIKYFASDINSEDLEIVSSYFKKNKIPGKTFLLDIRKTENLPKTDICLILKVLDIIDSKHNLSENLLKKIPSKILIVSFSTRKLSGKKMNFPRRYWFENLLSRLNYKFNTFESENEIFYIIELAKK